MGECVYCGIPAGFFRRSHPDCEEKHKGRERILRIAQEKVTAAVIGHTKGDGNLEEVNATIVRTQTACNLTPEQVRSMVAAGWENAVDAVLADKLLDAAEESRLIGVRDKFALTQVDLDANGAMTRAAKAGLLRDLTNGVMAPRIKFENPTVNLQKGEQIAWAFPNSEYWEDKVKREYVGRSSGWSMRVAKGVYYRTGSFRGTPVDRTTREFVDRGLVLLTDRNIYFAGSGKSVRVPYSKIVTFEPYSDGIAFIRDTAR